jgi:DNA polymerase I-like protein with 3'-5' exonuclease and polymerase domains
MLDKTFLPTDPPSLGFGIKLKSDTNWSESSRRLLIVLQTVDAADLKAGVLGSTPALVNAIKYARQHARRYKSDLPEFSFCIVNFNDKKHLHLRGAARAEAESEFKIRIQQLIKRLKPTHLLFSGDLNLLYSVPNAGLKNGWVYDLEGLKVVSTLDFARLLEKNGALANLLGFWCRHLANLMLERLPHSLASTKCKPIYIDTISKFDSMLKQWDKSTHIAVDTETRNLSVLKNAIYTIQLAFDTNLEQGFVIPIDHPHETNPFNKEERRYIKRALQAKFGSASAGPTLITFNGIFDLRVIRAALKLDIIYLPVWEITAGEHLLDENISSLASVGIKSGGLAAVYCAYGNDSYISGDMAFSKAERNTTGQISPADTDFLKYAALDVVSILSLKDKQIERAGHQELEGKSYRPYFVRHMMHQMSDSVHQMSHLKEAGSLIDRKYLRSLMASDSPLSKAISELTEEFKTYPQVKIANTQLLEESGFKTGSLFGSSSQWIFSLTKPAHKAKLFFEVIGLKAVNKTATGQDAVDKDFVDHYKDRDFVVALFGEFQAASKLLSTYVKGWYKQLTSEVDGATDGHLRADYKFFNVDTGRLASANPNLQNIPARGKLSKIIKEMFVAPDGCLLIRFDYSAHEVRGWSIVSGDKALASAFKAGQALRQQLIKNPSHFIKGDLPGSLTKEDRDSLLSELQQLKKEISANP